MTTLENQVNRRNTTAFIAARPTVVVLTRSVRTPDGAGGYVMSDPVDLPAQTMRLIPLSGVVIERQVESGRVAKPEYALLGVWDADLQRGDVFTLDGRRYEVAFINENRDYETKGEAIYLGSGT